ncbi:MAG: hypothetical protein QG577_2334, partial [Thermodesulfobacteriota bacterium]|nr:hypothetical protein [Thermodesulfobacteriota bacterium]
MINNELQVQVPENTLQSWQEIVDILADLMEIPAALIMRLRDPDI